MTNKNGQQPRSIAVVDVGFTNTKVVQFDPHGRVIAERKVASFHRQGPVYKEIEADPLLAFCRASLRELDAEFPIDVVVPCGHGAALACLAADGTLALPVMDYTSEPPAEVVAQYRYVEPPFSECFGPLLPMALTHALQLFWQQQACPAEFATVITILPWVQYISYRLSGRAVTEVSSISCQSQLMNIAQDQPSSVAMSQGWAKHFAPRAKAWEDIGAVQVVPGEPPWHGKVRVLAGVHDSNANYLRYLAGGLQHFTLLSTGTWIIGFDTDADIALLDHTRDTVTNTDVFGRPVACCRFYGGREFEIVAAGADGQLASLAGVQDLLNRQIFALPSFTDSGGPLPNTGGQGRILGVLPEVPELRASLAALYCALMASQSLDAIQSKHMIIVDGPFAKNLTFLSVLAALRPHQQVMASGLRDGTTAGACCLGMMADGKLPNIALDLQPIAPAAIPGMAAYALDWLKLGMARKA